MPRPHLIAICLASILVVGGLLFSPQSTGSVNRMSVEIPIGQPDEADTLNDTPSASAEDRLSNFQAPMPEGRSDDTGTAGQIQAGQPETPAPNASQTTAATAPKLIWKTEEVRTGDSLALIFKRAGATSRDLITIDRALKDKQWSRILPGQKVAFAFDPTGTLKQVTIHRSMLERYEVKLDDTGIQGQTVTETPDIQLAYAEGEIHDSLFADASRAGLPDTLIMSLANIFGWDIDFILDIREGDRFRVVYEEQYLGEKKIGLGGIVSAEFINQGRTFRAVRYTDSKGRTAYYTPEGRSMRKAFLRMPVDFARISSGFNLRRKHPVLNRIRAHKGTDYAAARGTPIKASGDGKVIFAGRKGGYGNTIILRHGQAITTLYAHMQKFARGIRAGKYVKQGQVIGYIGSTGLATGPHLHYEFRVNGVHRNPMTVKFPQASPVPKSERARFNQVAALAIEQLESMSGSTQVARLDTQ
ncbi:MAG: peptidase M23 [Gammaproteobacteria bacterium]|nr:MAG: peptidase M23 [Gammaproteobacteria bacterium]